MGRRTIPDFCDRLLDLAFALSLSLIHNELTGSGRLANAVAMLAGVIAVLHSSGRLVWLRLLTCLFSQIGLSWRIPFALFMTVLFAGLIQRSGQTRAIVGIVAIEPAFLALTAPFYL
jgi:hypothetical protein